MEPRPTAERMSMQPWINMNRVTSFLIGLLNTPSPTGYHEEAISYVQRSFEELELPGFVQERNRKGALIATLPGASATAPRAISAHVDTVGAMVRKVKDNGRLMLT